VDPAFDTEGNGTSADDHPLADIRLGERFIADTYHALAGAGYLDNTVLMVTFDEWGGFYDHVPPPRAGHRRHQPGRCGPHRAVLPQSGSPTGAGMVGFGRQLRNGA
jgi:phospholipase C